MKLKKLLPLLLLFFASNYVWADTEPDNNNAVTADAMTVDIASTGTINLASDLIDYYAFTTTADGKITLSLTGDVTYLTVRLYDADGTTVLGTVSDYSTVIVTVDGLAAGNYYAAVVAYAAYAGNYSITSSLINAEYANDAEVNDTFSEALDIAENGSVTGHIGFRYNGGTYDMNDWYKVVTTQDGKITATFANNTGDYNTIYIYDNDGVTLLGSTADYGTDTLIVTGKAAGTYYIRLNYYSTNYFNGYTITNTVTPTIFANDAEPNDTYASATVTIPENGSVNGHIGHRYNGGSYDTDDWYILNMSQDGQLQLNLTQGAGMYHGIYLYDNDGTTLLANNFEYATVSTIRYNLSAGTYYAKVDNYSATYYSGYSLQFVATPTAYASDAEPNEDYTEASVTIPVGGTVNGHIGFYRNGGTYDTDDWYKFTTTEDGIISLTLNQGTGMYHGIYLYDADGTTLLDNTFNYTTTTVAVTNLAAGDYYAKIDNYNATYYSSYSLTLNLTPSVYGNDPEPNGTLGEATPMLTNSTVDGHIGYRNNGTIYDENDYYKIDISEPGDLTLTIEKGPSQYNTIYILNSVGTTLEVQSNYGNFSISELNLAAGTYYARVNYYTSTHFGGYTLTNNYCPDQITIVAEGETTFCDGESIVLSTPDHHLNYLWSDGSVTETNTVTLSGDSYLTIDNGAGCVRISNTITTESTPLPVAVIEADGPTEFCLGGDVTLSVPVVADTYLWSNGATTSTITVNETGDYSVLLTKNGCSAISDPIHITVNANPVATITPDGATTFCEGGSVTLSASTAASYLWSNGVTTESVDVAASEDFTVTITDDNGCSNTSAITSVMVNENPTAGISADGPTTFCSGGSVNLMATGGATYLWNTGATTSSINVTTSGIYSATVYSAAGCSDNTITIEVVVEACGSVSIAADGPVEFCEGGSVTLTSTEADGNNWSTGETTQSIIVTESGDYYCTNGVNTSNTISVTVNANPIATISADGATEFCEGGSVNLTSSTANSYDWNTGATTASILVNTSGDYAVTITDANGCSATSATTTVTVNANPTATISADGATTFCDGGDVNLMASAASSYLWSNGSTDGTINVSASGDYSVMVTDANGCSATSENVTVTENANPTPVIVADGPVVFCGTDVTLNTDGVYDSYIWSNGETTSSITTATSGTYYVTVTSGLCEGTSNTIDVTADAAPSVTITSEGTLICYEASTMLTATTDAANIQWQRNGVDIAGANDATYYASLNGKYRAVVTTGECEATSLDIKLKYAERLEVTPSGTVGLCGGDVTMNVPAVMGATYQWYQNNVAIGGATANSYTTSTKGKFYCLATKDGCSSASKLLVVTDGCREGELSQQEMMVMPNPAADNFEIVFTVAQAGNAIIQITTITGSVILSENVEVIEGEQTRNYTTENMPSGMYLVNMQFADGAVIAHKIIIEK